jgi:molybdate transport system regulatory protein
LKNVDEQTVGHTASNSGYGQWVKGLLANIITPERRTHMATGLTSPVSARNQISGKVTDIQSGTAMSVVTVAGDGQQLLSAITNQAIEELALKKNDSVVALIKSTETMLIKGEMPGTKISARNKIHGRVTGIQKGNAMASVTIDSGSFKLTSAVTRQAVDELQLANGDAVTAVFKATEVVLHKAA